MKNFYHKKSWRTDLVQIHIEPHLISLIKSKLDLKMERDYVKIKLRRNPMSEKLDIFEF